MSELPDKSSTIPTFRTRDECPIAQHHLMTFGAGSERKKKYWEFRLRVRGFFSSQELTSDELKYLKETIGYDET